MNRTRFVLPALVAAFVVGLIRSPLALALQDGAPLTRTLTFKR